MNTTTYLDPILVRRQEYTDLLQKYTEITSQLAIETYKTQQMITKAKQAKAGFS
jgi:hypothetical protein